MFIIRATSKLTSNLTSRTSISNSSEYGIDEANNAREEEHNLTKQAFIIEVDYSTTYQE